MWDTAATLLIGLLTIAAGANLFAARPTRTLRSIRAEAELLELMDEGSAAREELHRQVEERVERYLAVSRRQARSGAGPSMWWFVAATVGLIVIVVVELLTPDDMLVTEAPWWALVMGVGGFLLGVGPLAVVTFATLRRWRP